MAAVTPQVLDSSALQGIAAAVPDIVGSTANAYKLKDMVDTSQMNTLKLAEAQKEIQTRQQTNEALKNLPLNATQEQRMAALEKIRQGPGGYEAAMQVMRNFGAVDKEAADRANLEAQTKKHLAEASAKTFEAYQDKLAAFDGNFLPVWQKFNNLVGKGMPVAQASAAVQPDYQRAYVGAISATDAAGNLIYNDPGSKQKFQQLGPAFDPDKLGPEIMQSEKIRKQLEEAQKARDESKFKGAETNLANVRANTIATAGSKAFTEDEGDLMAALADAGVNLPAGFKGKDQQKALYAGLIRKHPNMTVDEIADGIKAGTIRMVAEKSEARAVGTREASVDIPLAALTDKGGIFDQLDTAAKKINLGDSKTASQLRLAWAGKAVANPDILVYKNLVQDARSEMAQALQKGGAPTEGSAARAKEMFPDTMSLGEYQAAKGAAIAVAGAVKRGSARVLDAISNSKPLGEIISSAKRDTSDDGRAPPAGGPKEGDTATGPGGAKIKFSNGAWVKM